MRCQTPKSAQTVLKYVALLLCWVPSACATPTKQAQQLANCADVRFPPDLRVADPEVDKLAGVYNSGYQVLTVRRDEYRFFLISPRAGVRQLRMVDAWRFEDGCGAQYQFVLPLDGTGTVLKVHASNGMTSDLAKV